MVNLKRIGLDKERRIVLEAKKEGKLALRSAGSHSAIDVVIIDSDKLTIELIQCKATVGMNWKYIKPNLKKSLEKKNKYLDGTYKVTFKAL